MPVKVEVRLDVESMADFMIYRVYSSISGIVAIILGVLNVGLTVAFAMQKNYLYMFMFLVFAFLILGVFPYSIRNSVRKNMAKPTSRIQELTTYEFDETGITTTRGDDSGKASWGKFKKAIGRKRIIMLFDEQKQAIVLPVEQLGENYTAVVDLIFANMPAVAVRIMRTDKTDKK